MSTTMRWKMLTLATALVAACSDSTPKVVPVPEWTPLTSSCGGTDEPRCMLPWPSSAFLTTDTTTETGFRVNVETAATPQPDDPSSLNRADGFSRLTPLATGFTSDVDPATVGDGLARVFNAQPGSMFGNEIPVGIRLVRGVNNGVKEAMLVITPKRVLAAASIHLAVVVDSVRRPDGTSFQASRTTLVSLGLAAPTTPAETALFAHYTNARELLAMQKIDPAHVLRLWDFVTRSTMDATNRLLPMRAAAEAAVRAGTVGVVIDSTGGSTANIAVVVLGHLTGMPNFLSAEDQTGHLTYDSSGVPVAHGVRDVPFRVMLPRATRDYPLVIYGHGTGGDYNDDSFDDGLAGAGIAKIGFDFLGWTGNSIIATVIGLLRTIEGSDHSTAHLLQAHANIAAIEAILPGALSDALAQALTTAVPGTPALKPNMTQLLYAGGSLGGTMGLVHVSVDRARIRAGVLNVPGTAWTQFIALSDIVNLARDAWPSAKGGAVNLDLQLATSQTAWDDVDGANWVDALPTPVPPCLIQEDIGDPVLPNIGNELVAVSLGAVQVGVPLRVLPGLAHVEEAVAQSGLQQFHDTCGVDDCLHRFAQSNSLAGQAAREQIGTFLVTSLLGIPRVIVPSICTANVPDGSCDFSRAPF